MKPVVIEDLCIACGLCVEVCDEVFAQREDGIAYVLTPDPEPDQYACTQEAVEVCPTKAITLTAE